MNSGNREYKSDVFSMLMEDPANALEVYNAMNGTTYTDPSLVEMHTLDKGVLLAVRNDSSFVVDASLSLYEYQSAVHPNMPFWTMIYYSSVVQEMVKNIDKLSCSKIGMTTTRFVVFYNGDEDQPEQYEMRLSDFGGKKSENELVCYVYNINEGRNAKLMKNCKVLHEYMMFVDYIRAYYAELDYEGLETAINQAINRCVDENIMKDFLLSNRFEVVKAMDFNYARDRQIALERIGNREEGLKEGFEEGLRISIKN